MTPTDKLEMQVAEDPDGSVTVSLPDTDDRDDNTMRSESTEDANDNQADVDPEREAIRQARREERRLKKDIHREKAKESNHLITSLRSQNNQLAERLSILEKRTAGADVARLDKAIEDGHLRLQYAKMKIAEATKSQDGEGAANAQEAWYEARRNIEAMQALKKKASAEPTQAGVPKATDPRLQRHASEWMTRNDWYDPNNKDTDSKIAVKLDEALSEEGWDPTTEDYWDELDSRLSKYLPHRYNPKADTATKRPRSIVTGSGGESSSGGARPGEFRLSPERVKAIKDAGKWDSPAERQKMIKRYAEYDRTANTR